MPARGEDHGSFLHAAARDPPRRDAVDRLTLTPLSYDWFADRLHAGRDTDALHAVFDQKQNVLLVAPTSRLRSWLRGRSPGQPGMGAAGDVYPSESGEP